MKNSIKNNFNLLFNFLIMVLLLISCNPDLEDYEHLVNPVIIEEDSLNMIVITSKGDPRKFTEQNFIALFKTFKTIERENNDMNIGSFRIRWEVKDMTNPENCIANYGVPVPDKIGSIPRVIQKEYPEVKLEIWKYGTIGKILHIGSYETENKSIEKLDKFISNNHSVKDSILEEEYLQGPGFFTDGNPEEYYTIIRYFLTTDSLSTENSINIK